jgi:malate synthase
MKVVHGKNWTLRVLGPPIITSNGVNASDVILTNDCLQFVGTLCDQYENRRQLLLQQRQIRAISIDAGELPQFGQSVLSSIALTDEQWQCAKPPVDLQDRRVEITGPVDRKMVINGLNSGASVYMADFEDSTSPTWYNIVDGQLNLLDAVHRTISYINPMNNKLYQLNQSTSVLMVRPRGWHLHEGHVTINNVPISASIFDMAVYLFHCHVPLAVHQTGPYYYLPKIECAVEAALWNDIFVSAQQYLGIPIGTIRATVLLETITAAYEMEEILYALRDHSLGLNCGRWDYLFSYIKKLKAHTQYLTPDRQHLTMTCPLMVAYVSRLITICHKRGTFAMGGMSAAIPIKDDITRNNAAMDAVRGDKIREVTAGHDGTWVAHPALVNVALEIFNTHLTTPNQIHKVPSVGYHVTEKALLQLPTNIPLAQRVTKKDLQKGVGIVLAYTEAWLRGIGCIPLHGAMEDAATAEISRAQIWSWQKHCQVTTDDQAPITGERIVRMVQDQVQEQIISVKGNSNSFHKWLLAGQLVSQMLTAPVLDDFLTSVCYPHIVTIDYRPQMESTSKL